MFLFYEQYYNKMKIRRNDSYDNSHFFKLKELYFFKLLFYQYDLSLVKDYLKKSLDIIIFRKQTQIYLNQSNYVYIMSEESEITNSQTKETITIKQGHKIQPSILSLVVQSEILIYRVKIKTVLVLQTLYFLDVPFLKNMKSHEKFTFLQHCDLINLNFNSFIYRKGDCIDAVYFLIQGQVKMYKEINEKIYEVSSLQSKRIFGLFEIKSSLSYRQLYAKSNVNNLHVLRIPIKLIEEVCQMQQLSMIDYISNLKSELHSILKTELSNRQGLKTSEKQNNIRKTRHSQNLMNTKQFQKRLKNFEVNRNINYSVLNTVLKSKKLMLKVQELNLKVQNWVQVQSEQPLNTVYSIKHYNDKWRKQKVKKQKNKPLNLNSMTRSQQTRKFGVNGLLKYPAYKRYLMSRQCNQQSDNQHLTNREPNEMN